MTSQRLQSIIQASMEFLLCLFRWFMIQYNIIAIGINPIITIMVITIGPNRTSSGATNLPINFSNRISFYSFTIIFSHSLLSRIHQIFFYIRNLLPSKFKWLLRKLIFDCVCGWYIHLYNVQCNSFNMVSSIPRIYLYLFFIEMVRYLVGILFFFFFVCEYETNQNDISMRN